MFNHRTLILLIAFTFGANFIFTFSKMGKQVPWIDIPLHFLGGVIVGIIGVIYLGRHLAEKKVSDLGIFVSILGFAALIGVCWEFFEWTSDFLLASNYALPLSQISVSDTMGDLHMDLVGGFLMAIAFLVEKNKNKKTR